MTVHLLPDPYAPLWCLWLASPRLYLCGFLSRDRAVEYAAREGWEVVDG